MVPETQIAGEAQPYSAESSQGGILGFEEHMAHLEYGARRRFRISAPTLHVNSSANGTQQAVGRAVRAESERGRKVGLRSSSSLGQNNLSQSNFSRREDFGPPIGGAADAETTQPHTRGGINNSNRRSTPKKTGNWTDAALKAAIDAVTDQGMKVRCAARTFGIPPTSLRDHLFGKVVGRKRGTKTILSQEEEEKLIEYCFKMQDLGHPLTSGQLRLKVAQATQTRDTPWSASGVPGKSWLRSFKARHPDLVSRKSQPLELNRARGLCPRTAATLYSNLADLYNTFKYPPAHIWNCDESGVQAGRSGGATVLAKLGSKNVHAIEPDSREHLSVLSCINAAGGKIPNFYILKGKYFLQDYVRKCEPNAVMAMQPNAWMTKWLFESWISHFIGTLKATTGIDESKRHLLILDGHNSHVTLEVVQLAMNSGLDIVSLPSHTSHALQPLDVSCFKPFKTAFRKIRDNWTLLNKGKKVQKTDLCEWTSLALDKALTPKNIQAGFKKTGIWPLNENATTNSMQPSAGFQEGQAGFVPTVEEDSNNSSSSDEDEERSPQLRGEQHTSPLQCGAGQPTCNFESAQPGQQVLSSYPYFFTVDVVHSCMKGTTLHL